MTTTETVKFYIEVQIEVSGKFTPSIPDRFAGSPDNWEQGCGAEFEIETVKIIKDLREGETKKYVCPDEMIEAFDVDLIIDAVIQEIDG